MKTVTIIFAIATIIIPLALAAQPPEEPALWQPYYIYPRAGGQQVDLAGQWDLGHRDVPIVDPAELNSQKWIQAPVPATVQMALFRAGELPHPYYNLNSGKYSWVDEKVWYYKRSFDLPAGAAESYILLSFDGIDYFSRVWVNGKLMGRHEGMFGGPVIEISGAANPGGSNGLLVEVKAGNWGNKTGYQPRAPGKIIKPWVLAGGTGAEMFYPLGIWQGARIDIVPEVHIERPFLTTKSIGENEATLHLSAEILAGVHSLEGNLDAIVGQQLRDFRDTSTAKLLPGQYRIRFDLIDKQSNQRVFRENIPLDLYEGRNWVERDLSVPNPNLWWPNGLGDPNLYTARLVLIEGSAERDAISFDYGIRAIEVRPTPGPRYRDRWLDWQFAVNGREFFVKGINWMPADILLNVPREWYHWLLSAARNAGIQMIRVWGGGIIEPEALYSVANELGILVWQDFPIGNGTRPEWPADVWNAQVMQTVFRLRNHPSLALWCGGNEFNAYHPENAAVIGILERAVAGFDGTRPFRRTSPDGGSMHTYPDFDPTWYSRIYGQVPFMAETGMHNIPSAETMREVVSAEELAKPLSNMYTEEFGDLFPDFRHHFVEFEASRVPRMLSRASHIDDISAPLIESLAEGTQIGAGEFYQVMSEGLQANYPVTAGLLPWTFKRPWPVVAIQLLDGFGHPTAPYYFLKRTYEPAHVMARFPHLLNAPGQDVPLTLTVINSGDTLISNYTASVEVMDDSFETMWRQERAIALDAGPSAIDFELGAFTIPAGYADRFFFIVAELRTQEGVLISRSAYWPRSLTSINVEEFQSKPTEWPTLQRGPWLKPTVARTETGVEIYILSSAADRANRSILRARVKNTGAKPAPVTRIGIEGTKSSFFATDNFFWLAPGEERDLILYVLWREPETRSNAALSVSSWNSETKKVPLR